MSQTKPDKTFFASPATFQEIELSLDDLLPVNMVLLLGYQYQISPQKLLAALKQSLATFPHLSGKLSLNMEPFKVALVPGNLDVIVEWVQNAPGDLASMENMEQSILLSRYAPSAAAMGGPPMEMLRAPLLQIRLSWLEGSEYCVLGLMVSHMALDGVGLGLFLHHLTSAIKGIAPKSVEHSRGLLFPQKPPISQTLPEHYIEMPDIYQAISQAESNMSRLFVTVFSIQRQDLHKVFGGQTSQDVKLHLTAYICQKIAIMVADPCTMAFWCNTRGLGDVPRNYTGNTGCYVHYPLNPEDPKAGLEFLKGLGRRKGFAMISETYSRLKSAEFKGKLVFWEGPAKNLISVNLVPHLAEATDFGMGMPVYGQLLTRNVPGLRIYTSPDNQRIVVEMCFDKPYGEKLIDYFQDIDLPVKQWHTPQAKISLT